MIERLKALQMNRKQFANSSELFPHLSTDSDLRIEIESLSKAIFHKSVSGCSNCYFDAYIELISLNLNIAMEKLKCSFLLLAGALLHDVVNFDNDLLCSNANITDDLALYHLKTNPNCRQYFQTLPENVDELIEAYIIPGTEPVLSDEEKAALETAEKVQKEAEENFVSQIVTLLKNNITKTNIKTTFKNVENVGSVKLTQRILDAFIKRADAIFLAITAKSTEVGNELPVDVSPVDDEKAALESEKKPQ